MVLVGVVASRVVVCRCVPLCVVVRRRVSLCVVCLLLFDFEGLTVFYLSLILQMPTGTFDHRRWFTFLCDGGSNVGATHQTGVAKR